MVCLLLSAVDLASFAVFVVASSVLPWAVILVDRPLAVCSTVVALLIAPDAVFDTSATCVLMESAVCVNSDLVE